MPLATGSHIPFRHRCRPHMEFWPRDAVQVSSCRALRVQHARPGLQPRSGCLVGSWVGAAISLPCLPGPVRLRDSARQPRAPCNLPRGFPRWKCIPGAQPRITPTFPVFSQPPELPSPFPQALCRALAGPVLDVSCNPSSSFPHPGVDQCD